MDAGYFIMPYMGGIIIAFGTGFDILFYIGSGFILLSLFLALLLARIQRKEQTSHFGHKQKGKFKTI